MNTQEIIEGNKLIAEFVDLEVLANPHLGGVRPKSSNSTPVDLLKIIYCEIDYGQESVYPQFNSSWDWLMPVVDKCIKYCHDNMLEEWEQSFSDKFMICEIKALFNEVVKFIKWHNTNL